MATKLKYEHKMVTQSRGHNCTCGESFDNRSDLVDHVVEGANDVE